jgi:tRNA threonylcarbamoyladenosine biosynthesis protein TsaB
MIILACETSTLLGSVAIIKDDRILIEKQLLRQGSHTEVLNTFISECLDSEGLKLTDVDCFATGLGPGSFTGLRISLNSIKSFGYVFNKPVFGIDSLRNLAFLNQQFIADTSELKMITPMINAYKNMVYIAQYVLENKELIQIKPPQVVRVQALETFIDQSTYVVGDGYGTYEKYFSEPLMQKLHRFTKGFDHPTAASLGLMTATEENQKKYFTWNQLVPIYLRDSEAEEVMAGIKYQSL